MIIQLLIISVKTVFKPPKYYIYPSNKHSLIHTLVLKNSSENGVILYVWVVIINISRY